MFTTHNGGVPGTNTPTEKAPGTTNPKGLMADSNTADSRSHGATAKAHDGKAIATQIARLALAGHVVHKGQSGDYLVSKFGMTKHCSDFAELAAFAQKVGVN